MITFSFIYVEQLPSFWGSRGCKSEENSRTKHLLDEQLTNILNV